MQQVDFCSCELCQIVSIKPWSIAWLVELLFLVYFYCLKCIPYWCFIWKGWLITLFSLYGYSSSFALKKLVVNAIKTFGDMNGICQHRSDDSCMVTIILSPLVVYTALTGAHYCMCSVYTVAMSRYTYVTLHIKCLQFKTINMDW